MQSALIHYSRRKRLVCKLNSAIQADLTCTLSMYVGYVTLIWCSFKKTTSCSHMQCYASVTVGERQVRCRTPAMQISYFCFSHHFSKKALFCFLMAPMHVQSRNLLRSSASGVGAVVAVFQQQQQSGKEQNQHVTCTLHLSLASSISFHCNQFSFFFLNKKYV